MTPLQRRNLQLYLRYRVQPMSISGLLWANRWTYLVLSALFSGVAVIFFLADGTRTASYAGVAFAVLIARDIGFYRRSVALWPLLQEVIDWNQVERLAAQ